MLEYSKLTVIKNCYGYILGSLNERERENSIISWQLVLGEMICTFFLISFESSILSSQKISKTKSKISNN